MRKWLLPTVFKISENLDDDLKYLKIMKKKSKYT